MIRFLSNSTEIKFNKIGVHFSGSKWFQVLPKTVNNWNLARCFKTSLFFNSVWGKKNQSDVISGLYRGSHTAPCPLESCGGNRLHNINPLNEERYIVSRSVGSSDYQCSNRELHDAENELLFCHKKTFFYDIKLMPHGIRFDHGWKLTAFSSHDSITHIRGAFILSQSRSRSTQDNYHGFFKIASSKSLYWMDKSELNLQKRLRCKQH